MNELKKSRAFYDRFEEVKHEPLKKAILETTEQLKTVVIKKTKEKWDIKMVPFSVNKVDEKYVSIFTTPDNEYIKTERYSVFCKTKKDEVA